MRDRLRTESFTADLFELESGAQSLTLTPNPSGHSRGFFAWDSTPHSVSLFFDPDDVRKLAAWLNDSPLAPDGVNGLHDHEPMTMHG